jgi:hypothetical protein
LPDWILHLGLLSLIRPTAGSHTPTVLSPVCLFGSRQVAREAGDRIGAKIAYPLSSLDIKRSLYQDRLGTNIAKALEKRCGFRRAAARSRCGHAGSLQERRAARLDGFWPFGRHNRSVFELFLMFVPSLSW